MGKFFISLGAASVAFTLVAFALPQQILASPAIPAAESDRLPAALVPAMADLYYIEKILAPQHDLPAQF